MNLELGMFRAVLGAVVTACLVFSQNWANASLYSFSTDYSANTYIGAGGSTTGTFDISSQIGSDHVANARITAHFAENIGGDQSTRINEAAYWAGDAVGTAFCAIPNLVCKRYLITYYDDTIWWRDPYEAAYLRTTSGYGSGGSNYYHTNYYFGDSEVWLNDGYDLYVYHITYDITGYAGGFDVSYWLSSGDLSSLDSARLLDFTVGSLTGDFQFTGATLFVQASDGVASAQGPTSGVPEPESLALVALGLFGVATVRRRQRLSRQFRE